MQDVRQDAALARLGVTKTIGKKDEALMSALENIIRSHTLLGYNDLWDAGMGRFNSLYEHFEPDWNGGWDISRYQMADGSLWNKATDNFWQNHNILSSVWDINSHWTASASLATVRRWIGTRRPTSLASPHHRVASTATAICIGRSSG